LSTDTARTRSDEAAIDRMDVSWSLHNDQIMGGCVAPAIAAGCNCVGACVVSRRQFRIRINSRSSGLQCLWIEFADSAPRDPRAHRHASGVGHFSYRFSDLAKDPKATGMDAARPGLSFRAVNGIHVDQRPHCLRLFAPRDTGVSDVAAAIRVWRSNPCVVGPVALDRLPRCLHGVGCWWDLVSARLL